MYIFREMETFKNSDQIASQVYKHDTGNDEDDLRLAESQLFATMSSALVNNDVKMVVCDIVAPNGSVTRVESNVKPDPTPEPEQTE